MMMSLGDDVDGGFGEVEDEDVVAGIWRKNLFEPQEQTGLGRIRVPRKDWHLGGNDRSGMSCQVLVMDSPSFLSSSLL